MLNKTITVVDKLINAVMVIFFLLLLLIGGYALFDSYKIYDDTRLDDEILNLKPKVDENYNFERLREINFDVEGWITLFGTTIDYPILHSRDNLDYLNFNYKHEYALGGSIFTDYRNNWDFSDDYTIIYGHNMVTGQMFSDVKKYENADYFSQHLYGVLYTANEVYKLEVMYLAKIDAYKDDVYNLITHANGRNLELAAMVESRAIGINMVNDYSKLVLLSTCDSYGSNDRTVLLANMTTAEEEEILALERQAEEAAKLRDDGGVGGGWRKFRLCDWWWLILIIILIIVAVRVIRWYLKKDAAKKDETDSKK